MTPQQLLEEEQRGRGLTVTVKRLPRKYVSRGTVDLADMMTLMELMEEEDSN